MSESVVSGAVRGVRIMQKFSLFLLALLIALGFATPAFAGNDANGDDPQLEAPIQQGIALRRAGNDEAALALFLDLERANPDSIRVLLHVTTAAQATGRWLMAYSYLHKAFSHKGEPYFVRYRAAIKNIEDATNQHVGLFRAVGGPAGAEVRLNGEMLGTLPMAEAKPFEVGQYILEVTKTGFYPLRRPVSVVTGGGLTQESVELREASAASDSVASGGKNGVPSASGRLSTERPQSWWQARWVTWFLASATVVTTGGAVGALIYRNERAARWNGTGCLSGTLTREQVCGGIRDNISTAQDVAIGSGIAAVVFGTATLAQAVLSAHHSPEVGSTASSIGCSPGLGSVVCSGAF